MASTKPLLRPKPSSIVRLLVTKLSMLFSLNIPLLPLDFRLTQGVMIARAVKVDDIALARILKLRSV